MITVFLVIYLTIKILTLEGYIKGMKYTLNQLKHQSDFSENPVDDELRELIKTVKTIKKARETLGFSLLEGKRYIDKLKLSDR